MRLLRMAAPKKLPVIRILWISAKRELTAHGDYVHAVVMEICPGRRVHLVSQYFELSEYLYYSKSTLQIATNRMLASTRHRQGT